MSNMDKVICLSGNDWIFKDFIGLDWVWRDAEKPETRDTRFWKRGNVPGSVHNDLWGAGEIPNPYFEQNSLQIEWIPERTWIYKKRFYLGSEYRGRRLRLYFKGVDYEADFFLNGHLIGSHVGMFTPAVFDVEDVLKYGDYNTVSVVIHPSPVEEPQVGRSSKVRTHKSRMTYWWDFCPRMIHIGIWDDVFLEITGSLRIEDVYIRPVLNQDLSEAVIKIENIVSSNTPGNAILDQDIIYAGNIIASKKLDCCLKSGDNKIESDITIKDPMLWWPNGHGGQPLYTLRTRIWSPSSNSISHEKETIFGVRDVKIVQNEKADRSARGYTFVVNGKKIYIKGWNWVPIDVMYGVPRPEKLNRLFELAKRAHVNLFRVWGGGLIEKDDFYHMCDRYGIMVWQEFIQSSSGIENRPPDDAEFIEYMIKEAKSIIPLKRNHPSLVVWCGGNELQIEDEKPADNNELLLNALSKVVDELDPDRTWFPTSPTGRLFLNSIENIERDPTGLHDVHGPWEHQGLIEQYILYNKSTSLFHSEFGVEGMGHKKTIDATISRGNQWPAVKDNPVWFHRGAWWINEPFIQQAFGGIEDLDTLIMASQFLQNEGLRYAVEANRRRKYQNSGTVPWQFNEPYPNGYCTSVIDYYAQPKPAYYGVAKAYSPIHVTCQFERQVWERSHSFEASIWISNSHDMAYEEAVLHVQLVDMRGKAIKKERHSVSFGGNASAHLVDFECPLRDIKDNIFFLDLKILNMTGKVLSANSYVFTNTADLSPMLYTPKTPISIDVGKDKNIWRLNIKNMGDYVALPIWMEDGRGIDERGYVYFSDNNFILMPSEVKEIEVDWQNIDLRDRKIELRGWNVDKIIIG